MLVEKDLCAGSQYVRMRHRNRIVIVYDKLNLHIRSYSQNER